MKTEGIRRLVSALGNTPYNQANKQTPDKQVEAAGKASQAHNDAVKVSVNFKSTEQSSDASKSERSERVAQIKSEVEKGAYHVSSEKIATSLANELGL